MVDLFVLLWSRSDLYFHLSGYIFTFATLVVAAFRPYPKMCHTIVDLVVLSSVSLASFWYSVFFTASVLDPPRSSCKSLIVTGLLVSLPAVYALLLYLHKILPRSLMTKLKYLAVNRYGRSRGDYHKQLISQYYIIGDEHTPIL